MAAFAPDWPGLERGAKTEKDAVKSPAKTATTKKSTTTKSSSTKTDAKKK
jgi:hypothetical protein